MECLVCFDELITKQSEVICVECNLELHTECANIWFERNSICPQCRTLVVTINSPSQAIVTFPPDLDTSNLETAQVPTIQVPTIQAPTIIQAPTLASSISNPILFLRSNKLENYSICFFFLIFTILQELAVFTFKNISYYFYLIFPVTNLYLVLIASKRGKRLLRWIKFPVFVSILVFFTIMLITGSENAFNFHIAWIFTVNTFNIFYTILFFLL